MVIKLIDLDTVHFYSDSGELLLSEDVAEVFQPDVLQELLEIEQ